MPPTFIHEWNEPYLPLLPQLQSVTVLWPVLIFRPAEGRRLSWPEWLVTNRVGLPTRNMAHKKKFNTGSNKWSKILTKGRTAGDFFMDENLVYPPADFHHPSTNRARRTVTYWTYAVTRLLLT